MRTKEEQRNLQHVIDMFNNVLVPLDSTMVDKYISPNYIQHSQMAAPGVASLKKFLDERHLDSPEAEQHLKRSFVDGDHVILHYHVKRSKADPGFAVIDIFRLENGLIVEHWDCVQDVPTKSPNPNSMF
ncbi:MAG TPA: nuclear transport factor 2 family protein [Candidatus Acidoferrum sp.]|nr:nuclear transport factor 2 family protein [Candidatus Acidoferrum sp.]